MKVIFLDIDGILTHTDYLNWQTRHIDPEKVLEPLQTWDRQGCGGGEMAYQKYDMFHSFVRLFGMPGRQNWDKNLIRKRKKEISKELTDTIREKKLKRRMCMVCGRNLPFGYPYKLCQPCFEKKKFFEDFFETVDT